MAFLTPMLSKAFTDTGKTITAANRICAFDSTNGGVKMAAASTALQFAGVSSAATDINGGASVDMRGLLQVTAGGTVTKGDWIESDANGKGVTATAPAFTGATTKLLIGYAMNTCAAGDLIDVSIHPLLHRP